MVPSKKHRSVEKILRLSPVPSAKFLFGKNQTLVLFAPAAGSSNLDLGKGTNMKIRTLAVCLLFAGVCAAKEHDYQRGTLLRMDSSSCGSQEQGSKTVAGKFWHRRPAQENCGTALPGIHPAVRASLIAFVRKDDKHPSCCPSAKPRSSPQPTSSSPCPRTRRQRTRIHRCLHAGKRYSCSIRQQVAESFVPLCWRVAVV